MTKVNFVNMFQAAPSSVSAQWPPLRSSFTEFWYHGSPLLSSVDFTPTPLGCQLSSHALVLYRTVRYDILKMNETISMLIGTIGPCGMGMNCQLNWVRRSKGKVTGKRRIDLLVWYRHHS